MGVVLQINLMGAFNRKAMRRRKKAAAAELLDQVQNRIEAGGDEEYSFPPLDFARPDGTKDKPLHDTGKHLMDSLTSFVDDKGFGVSSNFIGAAVQQLGTAKKGGELAPIRPVTAKALFIPLTRRAQQSVLQFGTRMSDRRRASIVRRKGQRVAQTLQQLGGPEVNPGAKKPTKADFIFVQEVNIRARQFLRISAVGMQKLVAILRGH
jgi:phage gpG-like protein